MAVKWARTADSDWTEFIGRIISDLVAKYKKKLTNDLLRFVVVVALELKV